MDTWLLHVGEELPVDENPRLFRYGHLAHALVESGHHVLRWAPTFQHFRKQQRFDCDTRFAAGPRHDIQFVHAPGYARNVSLARWISYRMLGRRLRELMERERKPQVIVTGIPSLEWCQAAIDFGQRHGVPVVLDVRDLWPDVYLHALPPALRVLGSYALTPLRRQARQICQGATAIYGVSQTYLEWGLQHAGRGRQAFDQVFPLGYHPPKIDRAQRESTLCELAQQGIDQNKSICMFAGLIERLYDVETIVAAARQLERDFPGKYQFVICGRGSKSERVGYLSSTASNVVLLGWVPQQTIATLMSIAKIGLATYTANAPQSLPNKPFEYMAGGLAVVTSLTGELPRLLADHDCGLVYRAGDAKSLAAAIVSLSRNSARLKQLQRNSRRLFDERYHAEAIYRDFCDSLVGLVEQHHQPTTSIAA